MACLAYSSTRSSPKVEGISQSFIDHLLDFAHFPIYFILTYLWLVIFRPLKAVYRFGLAIGIAGGWGLINEYIQQFTPGRSCSMHDIVTNMTGASVAAGLVIVVELLYSPAK